MLNHNVVIRARSFTRHAIYSPLLVHLPDVQLLPDSCDGVGVAGGQDARVRLVPLGSDVPDTFHETRAI